MVVGLVLSEYVDTWQEGCLNWKMARGKGQGWGEKERVAYR